MKVKLYSYKKALKVIKEKERYTKDNSILGIPKSKWEILASSSVNVIYNKPIDGYVVVIVNTIPTYAIPTYLICKILSERD